MGGVVDMITGESNKKAASAADKSAKSQKAATDKVLQLFDLVLGKVKAADAAGQFDPTKQIQLANESSSYNEGLARTNMAAVNLSRGFRPGDSEPSLQDRDLAYQYQLQRRMQDQTIRGQSFQNMLGAYQSVNPGSALGAAGQYGQQMQQHLNSMTDPTAFWKSLATMYAMGGLGGGGGGTAWSNSGTVSGVVR